MSAQRGTRAPARPAPGRTGAGRARYEAERAGDAATEWAPTGARILLGLVLAWFGYHELIQPALWTGYVPGARAGSSLAVVLVLIHGWALLMLAAALIAGVMIRTAAAITALLLAEIVISLAITAGLSDLTLRDAGVLGLAVCLTGTARQRLVLTR